MFCAPSPWRLGVSWSILFVVIGLRYGLQMYADGSIFSYAIAVRDAWAFHWHNISDRLFVYLCCHLPAETYVELAGDAYGGIVVYGFLFFVAPLLGLAATFAADRSRGRIIFSYACLSTACLCPLVFGFPTEMWMAHVLFWPTLAVCHYARDSKRGIALVFAALLALVLTHEGALIFAVAIMATLSLRADGTPHSSGPPAPFLSSYRFGPSSRRHSRPTRTSRMSFTGLRCTSSTSPSWPAIWSCFC